MQPLSNGGKNVKEVLLYKYYLYVSGSQLFSRKHPLSSWVGTMLLCFAGSILSNLLVGEPMILVFKDHQALLTASIVW